MSCFTDESETKSNNVNFETYFKSICPYDKYMLLKIFVDSDKPEFLAQYEKAITNHNQKLCNTIDFMDAGFDLLIPYHESNYSVFGMTRCLSNRVNKVDLYVKCAAQMCNVDGSKTYNTGFYMYPRSSISKSCIRLANNVGIIDSGYRGRLIAMVDNVYEPEILLTPYDKYFQICAPGLVPVVVQLVYSEDDLGSPTPRGSGGFGSTGR